MSPPLRLSYLATYEEGAPARAKGPISLSVSTTNALTLVVGSVRFRQYRTRLFFEDRDR